MKKNYILSFFVVIMLLSFFSCSKEKTIIDEATIIIGFDPSVESITDGSGGQCYQYIFPDSTSFKSEDDFIKIKDKIDKTLGTLSSSDLKDVPVMNEYSESEINGLSDIYKWDTPSIRVVAEKFRALKLSTYIKIIITNK